MLTQAGRDAPGGVSPRYYAETMPRLDGQFVQNHGRGARRIALRGVLRASADSPALAHQNLKTALRTKQALVDGQTVATYVGTDGHSYANCMLISYEPGGEVHVCPAGPPYTATLFVTASVLQLTP
ncbi:MAG: hypothetical protein AMJ81_09295 [Phycisphaerae bacterium SM23_33]|nr:MAG: hypothetical protein AMJ81_09295 [Phycisphaerae bacterium SM23_33]